MEKDNSEVVGVFFTSFQVTIKLINQKREP